MSREFEFEIVVGLEVHTELSTNTKIFCNCTTEFGGEQNTHVCPVCLGLPGVLPVLNHEVVNRAIKAGLALHCTIAEFSKFDRKNYFYPDLPKAYQISQFDLPICKDGHLDIEIDGVTKRIGITRIHMEEDAGKLVHGGDTISSSDYSLADYNRGGVPLLEIVSEPDIRSVDEAVAYVEKLKSILEYTEVSECRMERGQLRCDANISLRPWGQKEFGTRTEIKNLNSFSALRRAMEYEIERQAEVLREGGVIVQETRTWDEGKGMTLSLRSKEEAHDYRYFPEPDLPPLVISREWVEKMRAELPELPEARKARLIQDYRLPEYDAAIITSSKAMAEYFDAVSHFLGIDQAGDKKEELAKLVSNWLMGDLSRVLNQEGKEFRDCPLKAENLAGMLKLLADGTISSKIAKTVFEEMYQSGKDAKTIVEEKGLVQISDEGAIKAVVQTVIANNPQPVADYKSGNERAIGFLVGQVMKETKGKANPGLVNKLLKEALDQ